MKPWLEALRARFDTLDERFRQHSIRERALIAAMVVGVVFFMLDRLLLQPVARERARIALATERAQAEIVSLESETLGFARSAMSDEERRVREEAQQLRLQLAQIDERTRSRISSLVPPEAIVSVLEELLERERGLRLVHLTSLPAIRIGAPEGGGEPLLDTGLPGLYRHGLRMQIEGSFPATLAYLRRVEDSRWNLLWERLEYRVDRFPLATITIDLHTISEQEEWIGV